MIKNKRRKVKPEVHKISRWALRRANGSFACIKQGAKFPFTDRDVGFYFSCDDRALSFNWLILDSRQQAEWYKTLLDINAEVPAGYKLQVVKVDIEIKITPPGGMYGRNW